MKIILCLAFTFAYIGLSQQISPEQRKEFEEKLIAACKDKESATDNDIKELIAQKPPSTQTGKCLHACVMETVGVIVDNKISVSGVENIANIVFENDQAKVAILKGVAEECAGVTDPDRCERTVKVMQCGDTAAKARGVNFEELFA